jgi:4-hydroxy-2-oxoheptanedioate aldolase
MTKGKLAPSSPVVTTPKRRFPAPSFHHPVMGAMIIGIAFIVALAIPAGIVSPQQAPYVHLNPVVEKLAQGKPIIGTQTADYSMANCRSLSRLNLDYVYLDMEHGVFDLKDMAECAAFMVDKAEAIKRGNAQVKVALFARFAPYGRDMDGSEWVAKQALDQGLMGVIFNGTDNAAQARHEVELMRYPQRRDSKYKEPIGRRGEGAGNAAFVWGVSGAEYERHADLWPLNPEGDLLCIPMIETLEGLKNVDEIAAVPGVGAIFVGVGGDLHQQLGVPPNSPEVEAAFGKILAACKAHNVPCAITAISKDDVEKRLGQGWKMIRTGRGE